MFRTITTRWLAARRPRPAARLLRGDATLERISESVGPLRRLTDRQLAERAHALRHHVSDARPAELAEELLVPGFALVYEAVRRTLALELHHVQLLAGLVLARGAVAEMHTGEGKTVTGVAPAFVHALSGNGVHIATVNRYLAERDYELLRPVYELLSLTVGVLKADDPPDRKRAMYACDVTFGPGFEFGFDYLRDQVAELDQRRPALGQRFRQALKGPTAPGRLPLQRGHAFVIIDEVDSVLIDEARTPLVLSGAANEEDADPTPFLEARRIALLLELDEDFCIDESSHRVRLTPEGVAKVDAVWGRIPNVILKRPWPTYVEQALQAEHLLQRDVNYVVAGQSVQIVDDSTGRIFTDRSWRDGLHQAVETKEEVAITGEKDSLAHISRQRYFRIYQTVAGMTGTATGSEREFGELFDLEVVPIPLHRPCRREVLPTRFFGDELSKWRAIIEDVVRLHGRRQPVLIGTRTIRSSEWVAQQLAARGVTFRLLNGKQDEDEARIVARAGEIGAVTIATNMAGRGTDIRVPPEALELGGLHVIGSERHDSARIDRQLIGRTARQGNPGSGQFFVSADDDLIRLFAPKLQRRMQRLPSHQGELKASLEHEISRLQHQVEQERYRHRAAMMRHDKWHEELLEKLAKSEGV